ncbi:MAG: hypothetical protein ACTSRG_23560 [Candidatus Helarchaeota archaeon]
MSAVIRDKLVITELTTEMKIDSFNCTNKKVNDFLKTNAISNQEKLISRVYVYLNIENGDIAGLISLSAYRLNLADSEKYSINKIPAVLLGRLAIDEKYLGHNLGMDLLEYASGICSKVKSLIGCRLLIIEVEKNDLVLEYFMNYGFKVERVKNFHYLSLDLLE